MVSQVKIRNMVMLAIVMLVVAACSCTALIDRVLVCKMQHLDGNLEEFEACTEYVEQVCPDDFEDEDLVALYEYRQCLHKLFPNVWPEPIPPDVTEEPIISTGGSNLPAGDQNLADNPSNTEDESPANLANPAVNCAPFRLTSPLDGLPNGVATFYWDPLPGATGYQIVASADRSAVFAAPGGVTTVNGDVSQNAIGGAFSVNIAALALIDGEVVCSTGINLPRAAPNPVDIQSVPPQPAPTPTDPIPG